ncbi:DNA recombination protein RmuC homolog [Chlamydiales bacterium SCGC AB-751-O23]|nr:DNA recombination protein RmuC homolog [Chlamydiales bacterium SCGC AB-751-O23]
MENSYLILHNILTVSLLFWCALLLWRLFSLKKAFKSLELKERDLDSQKKVELVEKEHLLQQVGRIGDLEELLEGKKEELAALKESLSLSKKDLESNLALFDQERQASKDKIQFLDQAKVQMSESFKALTHEIMQKQQESFLLSAKESFSHLKESSSKDLEHRQKAIKDFVGDLKSSLKDVNEKVEVLEKGRVKAYSSLESHLSQLQESQVNLQKETQQLVDTLRVPSARGRWGEMQLKRILELSGMLNRCDFFEQNSVEQEEGGKLRPDILVTLPNERSIIIDSKVPLQAFIESLDESNEKKQKVCLDKHSKSIRRHLQQLSSKNYWQQFESSPEFVVMFLPGETIYMTALQHDPELLEFALEKKVIIATPTTLIALLRSVAYGWSQSNLTENAKEISLLGKELYKRLSSFSLHFADLKKSLEKAVGSYNSAMGSFESRVLTTARKFVDLGASVDKEIAVTEPIQEVVRELSPLDKEL